MRFGGSDSARWGFLALTIAILHRVIGLNSVSGVCELSVVDRNKLYNYNLASPIRKYPHGVLNEDGLAITALRFNGFQPQSTDMHYCKDCGGPSRCGMGCSALMSNKIGGYPVCTTIGCTSNMIIHLIGTSGTGESWDL